MIAEECSAVLNWLLVMRAVTSIFHKGLPVTDGKPTSLGEGTFLSHRGSPATGIQEHFAIEHRSSS